MPSNFDNRVAFNPEVFAGYMGEIEDTDLHLLLSSGAVVQNNDIRDLFNEQHGAFIASVAYAGNIYDAEPVKYDGKTDIDSTDMDSYTENRVVVGLAKGFKATDFVYDVTAKDLDESEVEARQLANWQDKQRERIVYAELSGAFAGPLANTTHTYDVRNIVNSQGVTGHLDATSLNTGMQRACGDRKKTFALAIMPSAVATNLENLGLLTYVQNSDANGMQRDTSFARLNGRLVLVDDGVPVLYDESTAQYEKTSDVAIVSGKDYYTRSGSSPKYVYTLVEEPDVTDIGTYYEMTYPGDTLYQTFAFGLGAIEHTPCDVKVPYEMWRNPAKNGGETILYARQRDCFAIKGISFEGRNRLQSLSPSFAELADGQNWGLTSAPGGKTIDLKTIAVSRIISRG